MGRRGFTLLELMIVIIIVGILATIGITSYNSTIERSRGAEAKSVIGDLRTRCGLIYMENGSTALAGATQCNAAGLNLGAASGQVPAACAAAGSSLGYYFAYTITANTGTAVTFLATRCQGANGKRPGASAASSLQLVSDFSTGVDTWTSTPAGMY